MAAVQCRVCGQGDAIAYCSESGDPLCGQCAESCQVCRAPISKRRVQQTSTGRKLCSKCMAARNARRKAKKEELRRAQAGAGDAPAAAATSFNVLSAGAPPKSAGTSFQDLLDDNDAPLMPVRAIEEEREPDAREVHGLAREAGDDRIWGAEGPPKEGAGRLSLPPIDDRRPILTSSGYQGPSRAAWTAAFALFGLAAGIFWTVSPAFREILIPEGIARPDFVSGARPVATDTNQLRDAGNIRQFDILKYGPIFIAAWLVVGAYCLGFFLIMFSLVRSLTSTYFAKRRLKRAEEFAEKYGQPYPD